MVYGGFEIPSKVLEVVGEHLDLARSTMAKVIGGNTNFEVVLSGSLASEHYLGPKPRDHSMNRDCPLDLVTEIDIRICLPEPFVVDSTVNAFIRQLQQDHSQFEVCRQSQLLTSRRFLHHYNMFLIFYYFNVDGRSYEVEICFNKLPYIDISSLFPSFYTVSEMELQRHLLRELRDARKVDLRTYNRFKSALCEHLRFRLLALIYLSNIGRCEIRMGDNPTEKLSEENLSHLTDLAYAVFEKGLHRDEAFANIWGIKPPSDFKPRLEKLFPDWVLVAQEILVR